MIAKVKRFGKNFDVRITQGNQAFRLHYNGPRDECRRMAKMFNIALKLHDEKQMEKADLRRGKSQF
jgi:hypothetical protein